MESPRRFFVENLNWSLLESTSGGKFSGSDPHSTSISRIEPCRSPRHTQGEPKSHLGSTDGADVPAAPGGGHRDEGGHREGQANAQYSPSEGAVDG